MKDLILKQSRNYEIDGTGRKFKTPVEERVKKSKFAELLFEMSDQEIQALGYCLLKSPKVKRAIEYMSHTVENGVQIYALEQEYNKRFKIEKKLSN